MASTDQIDLVCHRCVSDEMLVAEIKQSGSKAKCSCYQENFCAVFHASTLHEEQRLTELIKKQPQQYS